MNTNMPYELDELIEILNEEKFNPNKSILEVFSQNILGFSGFVLLKSLLNDPLSASELSDAILYTSAAYLIMDALVLNNEKVFSYVKKGNALRQAEEILRLYDDYGISISIDDFKRSIKETTDDSGNYFYTFDNSDNIQLLAQTKKDSLFRKVRIFGVARNNYDHLLLYIK